jgi:predicted transcriptional regulator
MRARDVMSSPVITLRRDAPVRAAAALLVAHGFTAAPVVDGGQVIGIANEADLMRGHIVPDGWVVDELPEATVEAIMTPAPLSARPEDDLADVVAQMLDRGVRSVPVVDHGELVGMVSRCDVLRCVARRELTSQDVRRRRRTGSPPIDTASMPGSRA